MGDISKRNMSFKSVLYSTKTLKTNSKSMKIKKINENPLKIPRSLVKHLGPNPYSRDMLTSASVCAVCAF